MFFKDVLKYSTYLTVVKLSSLAQTCQSAAYLQLPGS